MDGLKPDMLIVDEPLEGVDFELVEKMIMSKLVTKTGSLELNSGFGEQVTDRYQERAKKSGITRSDAKFQMFSEDYGYGGTGVKDWKKDLRKLFVKPENE